MSVLENFKIYPGRPPIGRQAQSVIFFLQICNEVPGEKKGGLSPPQRATGGATPPPRATNGPGPRARQGGLSPPRGRQGGLSPPPRATGVCPPYITSNAPLLSSFESENSTKNPEKKRGVRRRKAAKPCRIQHL